MRDEIHIAAVHAIATYRLQLCAQFKTLAAFNSSYYLEFPGILFDDAGAEHVRHLKDLAMHAVVGGNISRPIAVQPRDNFVSRQVQMVVHHLCISGRGQFFGFAPLKKAAI